MDFLDKLNLQSLYSGANSKKIASINPCTAETITEVTAGSLDDYESIMRSSQAAFLHWRDVPAPKRGEIVRQIRDILIQKKDELGSLIALETGKTKFEGDCEVQEAIDLADFAQGESRRLYGRMMQSEREHHRLYEQWHPLGIVGVITAFNFPVSLWAWNIFIPIITGNCVIWKPSPKTPLCAVAIQQICNYVMEKNHCTGILNSLITEDINLAGKLVDDPRIALISFTGSSVVGKQVAQRVTERFGRCLLECDGNNAIIVDRTADLGIAIPAVVTGALATAGQRCVTPRRLIIHEAIYEKFLNKLIEAYRKVNIGDPFDSKNSMGPLINQAAVDNFVTAISKVKQRGGRILLGGEVVKGPGFFVQPTLVEADNSWDIVQVETFAPILYIMSFKSLTEAINLQNSVPQALSSAFFTNDLKAAELFLSAAGSNCGIANINISTSGAEFSGVGSFELGSPSWQNYMRRQSNAINWSDADG